MSCDIKGSRDVKKSPFRPINTFKDPAKNKQIMKKRTLVKHLLWV